MEIISEKIFEWCIQNQNLINIAIGVGILISGKLTILFGTILAVNNIISWFEFLKIAFGVLIVADIAVYAMSRQLRGTRFGWKIYRQIKSKKYAQISFYYFKRNMIVFFIISKFFLGIKLIALFITGWTRTSLSKFIGAYIPAIMIWFPAMVIASYLIISGFKYLEIKGVKIDPITLITIVATLMVVAPYIVRKTINTIMTRKRVKLKLTWLAGRKKSRRILGLVWLA